MILVIGANGMLGRDMMTLIGPAARGVDIDEIDITSLESTERVIRTLKPEAVINCAAYTDVDGCETNVETAMQVNGEDVVRGAILNALAPFKTKSGGYHLSSSYRYMIATVGSRDGPSRMGLS